MVYSLIDLIEFGSFCRVDKLIYVLYGDLKNNIFYDSFL